MCQLLFQEKSPVDDDTIREGATRDHLYKIVDRMVPHCGELITLWAYHAYRDIFTPDILRSFISGQGTSDDARRRHIPMFWRWQEDDIRAALTPLIAARPYAHWAEIFEAEDVPFAPVNGLEDLARDPQLKARGMVRSAGAAQVMAFPVPMAGMSDPAGHVPAVGEHQAEILDQAEKLE